MYGILHQTKPLDLAKQDISFLMRDLVTSTSGWFDTV